MPSSGLNAHRFDPMLMSFSESYSPSGTTTVKLVPSVVVGSRLTNSAGVSASPPSRFSENRNRGSPRPSRLAVRESPATKPSTLPLKYGSKTAALACLPSRPNVRE
jgi:hypothetical protein